jgi:integrase/recombinase XerD
MSRKLEKIDTLKLYIDYLVEHNYAPSTISSRQRMVSQFIKSRLPADSFIFGRPKASTQQKCKIVLQHFYQVLMQLGVVDTNPIGSIGKILQESRLPKFATQTTITNIIDSIGLDGFINIRDRAILEVGLSIAARRNDYVGMNLEDLDLENKTVKVFGKGRKEAYLPLNNHAINALSKYLPLREPLAKDNALFVTEHGIRLISYYDIFRKYTKEVTPHAFTRHSTAIACLQNGMDINVLQKFLRHCSLNTTSRYLEVTQENLKSIHARTHPRS